MTSNDKRLTADRRITLDARQRDYIVLAQQRGPVPEADAELVQAARLIDPTAWDVPKIEHSYLRRFRSLEAAGRLVAHREAVQAVTMALWQEPQPRVSLFARIRAFFASNQMEPT